MFCKNCGKEIDDKATICVHCGVPTANAQTQQQAVAPAAPNNGFAIAGLVCSFFSFAAVIGLILSIIGLRKAKTPEYNGKGKGLAIAGIVISCITLFYWIIIMATCGSALCAALNDPEVTGALLLPLV
ncbi:MAG: DUF4190 domain-containing protein [Clostridia bacterium]|nr:DUF4190 domain-containing protein [Clostridia bacterium]